MSWPASPNTLPAISMLCCHGIGSRPRHHAARRLNLPASNLKLPCGLHRMLSDHPTEPNAQELEFSPRPIELVGMGIAADHDRGALGHPTIALPQSHSSALGEIDQLLQRAMA